MSDDQNKDATTTEATTDDSDRDFETMPFADEGALTANADLETDAAEVAARSDAERARRRLIADMDARRAESARAKADTAEAEGEPLLSAPFAPKRGVERWPVKIVNDEDKERIDPEVQDTTIEDLLLIQRPADMPFKKRVKRYQANRAAPAETTIWRIEARIISHKWEKDGDFHVVIQSLESGYTMIIETPQEGVGSDGQPFIDDDSRFKEQIEEARLALADRLQPTTHFNNESIRVRITGVGFFDLMHGQTGVAQTNALELHPVLAVEFLE